MNLLSRLSSLPFTIAFDILFGHGGFAAFVDAHGGRVSEASYQFWRIYFVSSPIGKLRPIATSAWVEVMCTCLTVQYLPHPAHCVYLLRPVSHVVPESVNAWKVAREVAIRQPPCPETLVRAMKLFISAKEPFTSHLQREWFCVADVCVCRSLEEWRLFAEEVISNHIFTQYWWTGQKEGPFYLLDGCMPLMRDVISGLSKRESIHLMSRLIREETADARYVKRRKIEKKEWMAKNEAGSAKGGAVSQPAQSTSSKPKALTRQEKEEINRLAGIQYTKLVSTVTAFKLALQTLTDEKMTGRVVRLTAALCNQHPRIKWSIRRDLHERLVSRSAWDVERELHGYKNGKDKESLTKLQQMALL